MRPTPFPGIRPWPCLPAIDPGCLMPAGDVNDRPCLFFGHVLDTFPAVVTWRRYLFRLLIWTGGRGIGVRIGRCAGHGYLSW